SDNTIVAATYGRGMFTSVIPSTPEIRFTTSGLTATESASVTSGCRRFKDYTINVAKVGTSTGTATVTYNLHSGNTAMPGVDFNFTTNGDFSSPSTQHTFTAGAGQTKTIAIRIYDDAEVEADESFILDMAVSGITNAVAAPQNSFAVTIKSNDAAPIPLAFPFATIVPAAYTLG